MPKIQTIKKVVIEFDLTNEQDVKKYQLYQEAENMKNLLVDILFDYTGEIFQERFSEVEKQAKIELMNQIRDKTKNFNINILK